MTWVTIRSTLGSKLQLPHPRLFRAKENSQENPTFEDDFNVGKNGEGTYVRPIGSYSAY